MLAIKRTSGRICSARGRNLEEAFLTDMWPAAGSSLSGGAGRQGARAEYDGLLPHARILAEANAARDGLVRAVVLQRCAGSGDRRLANHPREERRQGMKPLVRAATEADAAAWDRFAAEHPHGGPFHTMAWKRSIESTYGFAPKYLLAEREGRIEAVLPLFVVAGWLTGKILLSTPFAVYGGALAANSEALDELKAEVERLARAEKVQFVELRNRDAEQALGWARIDRYVTFTQEIGPDAEALLQGLPREARRMTRRALEQPYRVERTRDPERFCDLYSANLRKLGTPSFSDRHFANLLREFPDADIHEIWLGEKLAAAVFSFYSGDAVLPYYGASDPALNRMNPNNFMYYDLMSRCGARGLRSFDFGRSKKGSGSYAFKAHWGMREEELPYEVLLVERKEMPNFSPVNPKYDLAIRVWRRLPLWLTRKLGPYLNRQFP